MGAIAMMNGGQMRNGAIPIALLLLAASLSPIGASAETVQEQPTLQADAATITGKLTAISNTFVQVGSTLYDLTDQVTVKDPAGNPMSLSDLKPGMDVRCQVVTSRDGEQKIQTIRIFVQ